MLRRNKGRDSTAVELRLTQRRTEDPVKLNLDTRLEEKNASIPEAISI